jgi:hypothetical protein
MALEDDIRDPVTKHLLVDIELHVALASGPCGGLYEPDVLYLGRKQHRQLLQFFTNAAMTRGAAADPGYKIVSTWRGLPVMRVDAEDHLGVSWKQSAAIRALIMDLQATAPSDTEGKPN